MQVSHQGPIRRQETIYNNDIAKNIKTSTGILPIFMMASDPKWKQNSDLKSLVAKDVS